MSNHILAQCQHRCPTYHISLIVISESSAPPHVETVVRVKVEGSADTSMTEAKHPTLVSQLSSESGKKLLINVKEGW